MNAKHTPGPWTYAPNMHDVVILGDNGSLVAAIRPQRDSADTDFANARLIAAAPELLEACRAAVEALHAAKGCPFGAVYAPTATCDCNYHAAYQSVRLAIAKAEGTK